MLGGAIDIYTEWRGRGSWSILRWVHSARAVVVRGRGSIIEA